MEGISRKPRSVKRRETESPERDQSAPAKVQKLVAPSSPLVQRPGQASLPLPFPVLEPERGSPSLAEVPPLEAGIPSGEDGIQPLAAVPLTVWKVPSEHAKSSPGKSVEPRRRSKSATDENEDSLLSNANLAASAVSSILKDSDVARSKGLPVDEVLASSFQGFALVSLSSRLLPYWFCNEH